jgi:enoyl-CoA hydratase
MSEPLSAASGVRAYDDGRASIVLLDRPKSLNALSHDMIRTIETACHRAAKNAHIYGMVRRADGDGAFCAGADVREILSLITAGDPRAFDFFRDEYQQNWTLQNLIKPTVSLINGLVMGGGVGISLYGTHRVAGPDYRFAMPETAIGLFPDIGASFFLPRLPGRVGLYLSLTGASIGPADAYWLELVTHCVDAAQFDAIEGAMREADPIDAFLDGLHRDPEPGPLQRLAPVIDRLFEGASVGDILAALDREHGAHSDWARAAAQTMRERSPQSLKLAMRLYQEGARLNSLKATLVLEYRAMRHCLRAPDFAEGVRARLIDKDGAPSWRPSRLEDVDDALIATWLGPPEDGDDLLLKDHWQLVD